MGQRLFLAVFFPLSLSLSLSRARDSCKLVCLLDLPGPGHNTDGPARATVTVFVLRVTADGEWGNADEGRGGTILGVATYLFDLPASRASLSLSSVAESRPKK